MKCNAQAEGNMKIASIAIAAMVVMAAADVHAFETVVKVVSVTPGREIVNEPYQSCQGNGQRNCEQVDHYDVKTLYTVVYEYQGQRFSAKLPYDPGPELKVNVSVEPK
jgi:uncharacterized protein YcfJ